MQARIGTRAGIRLELLPPAVRARPNLTIRFFSYVSNILLEKCDGVKRAVAVRTCGDLIFRARREIIMGAGALNTPRILQLSGIGDRERLKKLGIKCVHDLPGVGRNLMDHFRIPGMPQYVLTSTVPVVDLTTDIWWLGLNSGLFPTGSSDVQIGYRFVVNTSDGTIQTQAEREFFIVRHNIRGCLHIQSADPNVRPEIQGVYDMTDEEGNFLPEIAHQLVFLWRTLEQIYERPNVQVLGGNEFSVFYQPGLSDQEVLAEFRRAFQFWPAPTRLELGLASPFLDDIHYMGTCRMGQRSDKFAVTDDQFRVHGIPNLRIVDASILPDIPPRHMSINPYMFGEKISDLLKASQN